MDYLYTLLIFLALYLAVGGWHAHESLWPFSEDTQLQEWLADAETRSDRIRYWISFLVTGYGFLMVMWLPLRLGWRPRR